MKVRITFPERVIFRTELPLGIWHINYGNHMDNAAPLQLAHEARLRWLASLGYREDDIGEGVGLIMADAAIQYLAEAFHGDELLVELGLELERLLSFRLYYRFVRKQDQKVICLVTTRMVAFSYEQRRPVPLPPAFKARLEALLGPDIE